MPPPPAPPPVDVGLGISEREIVKALAQLEAIGEINNTPVPALALILSKAREKMEGGP